MSNFPGYPPPFSAWDSFTSTNRTPFPLGNLPVPVPGFPSVVPSLTDPGYFPVRPAFSEPLSLAAGVYRPLASRYLPGITDLPVLGLEPLYGFGPQEPRSLLHSPNFAFSQNPSPLTFDQIYRSSGASSVSPVSQYRNQFDQRYLGGHLGLPGRYSEPLCGQSRFSVHKDTTDIKEKCFKEDVKQQKESKSSSESKKKTGEKKVKLWNPFVSDLPNENKDSFSNDKAVVLSDSKLNTGEGERKSKTDNTESVDANANSLTKVEKECVKTLPDTRKPQFPVRPIPVFSSHYSSRHYDHFQTAPLPSHVIDVCSKPEESTVDSVENKSLDKLKENPEQNTAQTDCQINTNSAVENEEKDLNQNCEIVKNSNFIFEDKCSLKVGNTEEIIQSSDVNCSEVEINPKLDNTSDKGFENDDSKSKCEESERKSDVQILSDVNDKSQNQVSTESSTFLNKSDFQSEFSNFISKSVPYTTSVHVNIDESLPNSDNSVKLSDRLTHSVALNLCSPKSSESKVHQSGNTKQKSPSSRKEELIQLSIQVNEVRKRRNSKDSNSDKVLSPPLKSAPKPKALCSSRDRRFSHPPTRQPAGHRRHRVRMASAEGAITMMKNTEDSLSASISSSHLSESDSDTQLSNENPDKLFHESQPMNTQSTYSPNQSLDQNYLPSLNVDQMSHDNQYYKTNNPQMCQNDADNQKPYPCVQEQGMFNEKPPVLPPFSCYSSNQNADVLPREPTFHSQEENSNFPPNLGVDSSMEYDENSVLSDNTQMQPECEPQQHSISQNVEPVANKDAMLHGGNHSITLGNPESYINDPGQWDFLHSKQYIENIYGSQIGCEIVKSEEETLRESDSPKTFLDLDTTTKEKQVTEDHKGKMSKEGLSSKHYGKSYVRQGYAGNQRNAPNMYGNQSMESYGNGVGNRWNSFNRGDGMVRNQSRPVGDNYGGHYEQNPSQYRGNYHQNYSHMNQGQNGGEKPFIQPGYHGNEYNQSDYYNQNQSMKNYQGNYNPRFENNYYQNKGGNEYNSQGNMYPSNSGEIQGSARFGNQGFNGGQGGYGQHYNQQPTSHSGSDGMGQYPENTSYSIPRNASPASTGSDFSNMEAPPPGIVKKKRGRKRKVDKEPPDENKPRPNTVVMAPTKIGPLIDIDNPECTIDTYDYNNQIETIFNFNIEDDLTPIGAQYLQIEQRICQKMLPIKYGYPVTVVYSPLTYAFQTHRDFVSKFCTSERTILFLGMNPGPYGMSQNGVPFGEALTTRNWLKITGDVYKPEIEHPKKLITGLACTRNEVSGARFWGLFQKICKVPANFFKNCFVYNFCPLAYMSESGKNITPPQLVHSELDQINEACDAGLVELVKLLNIRMVIAVGKFVQQRASKALHNAGIMNIKVECILHPSPINPHANKGWEQIVAKQLIEMNVMHYLNNDVDDVQRCIEEWERIAQSNMKVPIVSKEEY
ncbi:uncharacterized protein LOC123559429 isoform X2 [Mercenaria mercenaria]|uniref:uncharacterized protein LOC123559429 isoform X2 n=1 Tax=Mercenaria mercenaria TaxID=6596 RepID=UPI00234E5382|nr:uncharacterized protein LOC123559429 isoform X2 [Mercenaria mercenaria]